jgi:DNA polymerase (family 10)
VVEVYTHLNSTIPLSEKGVRLQTTVPGVPELALAITGTAGIQTADPIAASVREFLLTRCGARRAAAAGDYRRRVAVRSELVFVIGTDQFPALVSRLERFGGRAERLSADETTAVLRLSSGILLSAQSAAPDNWGLELIRYTGSQAHLNQLEAAGLGLQKLARSRQPYPEEAAIYRAVGLSFIDPELREGLDEVELARKGALPVLITAADIRGELHAHSTSSNGRNTIEQMARAAREKGYEYLGITDHSQSLKIAGGLPEENLWKQIATSTS